MMTTVIAAVIGLPTTVSILKEPSEVRASLQSGARSERQPASVDGTTAEPSSLLASPSIIRLGCESEDEVQEVDGRRVRLVGDECEGGEGRLEVVNHSNGFTASVIRLKDKTYTTDFIDLKEGQNQFELSRVDSSGNVVSRNVTIVRRKPASQ